MWGTTRQALFHHVTTELLASPWCRGGPARRAVDGQVVAMRQFSGGIAAAEFVLLPSPVGAEVSPAMTPSASGTDPGSDDGTAVADPGMARAGAAAAARRRELDISQRSLAADGIINAGALIAFEKG